MQSVQRYTVQTLRRLRPNAVNQQKRYASGSHNSHHTGPANESFGTGFYLSLAALPASFALYKFSKQGTDEQPYFTRVITETYNEYAKKWAERNDIHTQGRERAAADRVLFLNESNQNVRHVNLRYPEQLNAGSPWNVPAGHGSANLDELIAKFEKEVYAENERKHQQLKDNNVPVEQPLKPFPRA